MDSCIKVTYDADGAQRHLAWSQAEATATIGVTFDAPTLSGDNLNGVTYTSSNKAVAYIDQDGAVTINAAGETRISAIAPANGLWNADSTSYALTVEASLVTVSETIHVATPGTFKELMVDLETRPQRLTLTGTLNAADLEYLRGGQGKMASVSDLDLSGVHFLYDNGAYATISMSDGSGVGMGKIVRTFHLSETCRSDTAFYDTGLGGTNKEISIYANNLAGLFAGNATLRQVILPTGLDGIGSFLFHASAVQNVIFPQNIAEIPEYAFAETGSLVYLELPATVTTVGTCAFSASNIRELATQGVQTIGEKAFYYSRIENIDLGLVRNIGAWAFYGTPNLASVNLANVGQIPDYGFGESAIRSVTLGDGLSEIGAGAFYCCKNLTAVTLPTAVTSIGRAAFSSSGITAFNVPDNVEYIGRDALANTPWFSKQPTEEGVWYFGKVAYKYDDNAAGVSTLAIKEGTKAISSSFASESLRNTLRKLTLPASLIQIGEYTTTGYSSEVACFLGCTQLEEVNLPDSLKVIGDAAFSGCRKMEISSWPAALTGIGECAFLDCKSLYSLTLPESLRYVGAEAFKGCDGLSSVKIYAHCLQSSSTNAVFPASLEKATIGSAVTSIPSWMFYGCSGLVKVVFEDGEADAPALEIGDYAFSGCDALAISTLPSRTTKVGEYTFDGVRFGADFSTGNMTTIGSRAFYRASGIARLTITNSLEECGGGAFSDIETLETIYYNAPNLAILADSYYRSPFDRGSSFDSYNLTDITIGSDVEHIPDQLFGYQPSVVTVTFEPRLETTRSGARPLTIGERAFASCGMKTIDLPDANTEIGMGAFAYCSSLREARLGNGTVSIGPKAFFETGIRTIDLPATVSEIGADALMNNSLSTVYFHTQEPPALTAAIVKTTVTAYVPAAGETAYKESLLKSNPIKIYSIDSFTLSKDEAALDNGQTLQLNAVIAPSEYAGLDLTWSSSNADVAVVNNAGVVAGVGIGKAVITAAITHMDGYNASCVVTVSDPSGIETTVADFDKNSTMEIYNTQGVKVANSLDNLVNGVYIIRQGENAKKIIVANRCAL